MGNVATEHYYEQLALVEEMFDKWYSFVKTGKSESNTDTVFPKLKEFSTHRQILFLENQGKALEEWLWDKDGKPTSLHMALSDLHNHLCSVLEPQFLAIFQRHIVQITLPHVPIRMAKKVYREYPFMYFFNVIQRKVVWKDICGVK